MTGLRAKLVERLGPLGKETAVLTVGSTIAMTTGLFVLALLVKTLPSSEVGMLILVSTFPLLIHQFFNLQSWQGFSRHALPLLEQRQTAAFQGLTWSYFRLDAACAALSTIAGLLLSGVAITVFGWPEVWRVMMCLFCLTLLTNFSSFSFAVFRCFQAYRTQAVCTLALPASQLFCAILFASQERVVGDYLVAWLLLMVASNLLMLVCAVVLLRSKNMRGWFRSAVPAPVGALTFTAWVNAATSLDCVVKQGDVLLVSALVSVESVPAYRLIKQAGALLYRFADAVAQATYPRLVSMVVTNQQQEALALFRTSALWSSGLASIAALALATTSSLWLPVLFTPEFLQVSSILAAYLFIVVLAVAFTTLHQLVYALGYVKLPVLFTLIAVSTFLIATISLAPSFGLWGFVLGFAGYHLVAIGLKLALLERHYRAGQQHVVVH